jgi:hypothetical protein
MAGMTGLEPATFGVTSRHSNQLSYTPSEKVSKRSLSLARRRPIVKGLMRHPRPHAAFL